MPEFLSALSGLTADLGVVAAYGRILPDNVLQCPTLGMINVHASLLPRYRGAAPVHRAVISGERKTGATIMRVVTELDAGPMLARRELEIGPDETSDLVESRLAVVGADLLLPVIGALAEGTTLEEPQNHEAASYAPRITREDGRIDWSRPAVAVHNLVRGVHPWPHAYTFLHSQRVVILRTSTADPGGHSTSPRPGTIVEAVADRLAIATGDGLIRVLTLQLEGRRALTAREFLSGHRLDRGDTFSSAPVA